MEKDYRIHNPELAEIMAYEEKPYREMAARLAIKGASAEKINETIREGEIISNIEARIYITDLKDTISYHETRAERKILFSITIDELREYGNQHGFHPNTTTRTLRYLLSRADYDAKLPESKKTLQKISNEQEKITTFEFYKSPSIFLKEDVSIPVYGEKTREYLEALEDFKLADQEPQK